MLLATENTLNTGTINVLILVYFIKIKHVIIYPAMTTTTMNELFFFVCFGV